MADPDLVDELRRTVSDLLDQMAAATEDRRFRSAAAMVRGQRGGRRKYDDSKPLEYAETLLAMNAATTVNRACEMTAIVFAPAHQVETMRDRLRRKLRTKLVKSKD